MSDVQVEAGRLAIVTEDGDNILIDREEAPKVYKAWEAWIAAETASSEEAHRWNEVLEAATEHMHDAGFTDDTAEDVIRAEELDGSDAEQEAGNAESDAQVTPEITAALDVVRAAGFAVVAFTPAELRGADVERVQDRLCELGWEVIGDLA